MNRFIKVNELPKDAIFLTDSKEVEYLNSLAKQAFNFEHEPFDSFFVTKGEKELAHIYGMYGIVPYLHKEITQIA